MITIDFSVGTIRQLPDDEREYSTSGRYSRIKTFYLIFLVTFTNQERENKIDDRYPIRKMVKTKLPEKTKISKTKTNKESSSTTEEISTPENLINLTLVALFIHPKSTKVSVAITI